MGNRPSIIKMPSLLYQDEAILVINKTPGLLSIPDGYDPTLSHLKSVLEPLYGDLWMVHRLDKETSGVIVLARNANAHRKLNADFQTKQIEKYYHGLVTPVPNWRRMNIELPLEVDADRKHRTRVNYENGKDATSICQVLKRYTLGVLMEIQILSGITHQIRAHLRAYDLVLFGETLYNAGLPSQPFQVQRLILHARTLRFPHPSNGDWCSFTAPYPEDFRHAYAKLRATRAPDGAI